MRKTPQITCQLSLVIVAADSPHRRVPVWARDSAGTAQGRPAPGGYRARMGGLAQDVQSITRQVQMTASDDPEQRANIAAVDARPMPNPHYDRLPAGYQPLEPPQ